MLGPVRKSTCPLPAAAAFVAVLVVPVAASDLVISASAVRIRLPIDLAQDIGKGFMLAKARSRLEDGVLWIAGEIINTRSVIHDDCTFRLNLAAGQSRSFVLPKLRPGTGRAFEVGFSGYRGTLPPAVTIEFQRSAVLYRIDERQPRSVSAPSR